MEEDEIESVGSRWCQEAVRVLRRARELYDFPIKKDHLIPVCKEKTDRRGLLNSES